MKSLEPQKTSLEQKIDMLMEKKISLYSKNDIARSKITALDPQNDNFSRPIK